MVLAEKNSENARNGRRSRGPSPNGHVQAESTSEDESTGEVVRCSSFSRFCLFVEAFEALILFFSTSR